MFEETIKVDGTHKSRFTYVSGGVTKPAELR
jgi:hypothetical protein